MQICAQGTQPKNEIRGGLLFLHAGLSSSPQARRAHRGRGDYVCKHTLDTTQWMLHKVKGQPWSAHDLEPLRLGTELGPEVARYHVQTCCVSCDTQMHYITCASAAL